MDVRSELRGRLTATVLALLAAFLWSTYYLFVLAVRPTTGSSAVLLYPFLGGGVAYAAWVVARGEGGALGRVFREGAAYARVALLLGMQFSILAATYLIGPVDASLLSLLGDVVATPVLVLALFAEDRGDVGTPWLVVGLGLSLAGGGLAIVGGHGLAAVRGVGWTVVVAVPLSVALYFVLSARAGAHGSVSAVVAQSMLGAAVGTAAVLPWIPGGLHAVVAIRAVPLGLLLVNGAVSFFLAPLLYFRAIARAGLVLPPMLMTGIPVFTLLLSATVLAIPAAPLALLGVPIAVVGGVVVLASGRSGAPAR